jgi:hypothetical protein
VRRALEGEIAIQAPQSRRPKPQPGHTRRLSRGLFTPEIVGLGVIRSNPMQWTPDSDDLGCFGIKILILALPGLSTDQGLKVSPDPKIVSLGTGSAPNPWCERAPRDYPSVLRGHFSSGPSTPAWPRAAAASLRPVRSAPPAPPAGWTDPPPGQHAARRHSGGVSSRRADACKWCGQHPTPMHRRRGRPG